MVPAGASADRKPRCNPDPPRPGRTSRFRRRPDSMGSVTSMRTIRAPAGSTASRKHPRPTTRQTTDPVQASVRCPRMSPTASVPAPQRAPVMNDRSVPIRIQSGSPSLRNQNISQRVRGSLDRCSELIGPYRGSNRNSLHAILPFQNGVAAVGFMPISRQGDSTDVKTKQVQPRHRPPNVSPMTR